MRDERRRDGGAAGDSEAGTAERRAAPAAGYPRRGVVEGETAARRIGRGGVGDVAIDERHQREIVAARHRLEQADRVEAARPRRRAGVERREHLEGGAAGLTVEEGGGVVGGRRAADRGGDRHQRQHGVRAGERGGDGHALGQREDLLPRLRRRGAGERVRAGGEHLRRGVERQRPGAAGIDVALQARADDGGADRGEVGRRQHLLHRHQTAGGDRLAEVGMVEHQEVVARREVGDRVRLEAFQRLPVPGDGEPLRRRHLGGGRLQRRVAARMVPGEAADGRRAGGAHGRRHAALSPTAPPATSASMRAAS
eukprot:Opistho-1_new@29422